jgi:NAD(P)-dependent dehydrogenase (short-subunit alcohol dehydrogenase family)
MLNTDSLVRTLEGQIALVSGGNRGIGYAIARALGQFGAVVFVGSRIRAEAERTTLQLRNEGIDARPVELDVTRAESVSRLANLLEHQAGHLDILINNAGIIDEQSTLRSDIERARHILDVNLLGIWRLTAAMAPLLRRGNHQRVVNVSSGAGSITELPEKIPHGEGPNFAAYRISKAAVNALTRIQAMELAPHRILVNAACPGWVDTEMGRRMGATSSDRTPADGARSVIDLVMVPDTGPTGGFFRDGQPLPW